MASISQKPTVAIFLDIDGVLFPEAMNIKPSREVIDKVNKHENYLKKNTNSYSHNWWSIANAHYFSPTAVNNLERLITKISAFAEPTIIISSAWRKQKTVEELKSIFFGMHKFSQYISGKTADTYKSRGQEIKDYLTEHPEIQFKLILDNEDFGISEQFEDCFIRVSSVFLLSETNIEKAIDILKSKIQPA